MERPKPPSDLTPDQAEIWVQVAKSKPSDWFTPDSLPILEAYAVAAVRHKQIRKALDQLSVDDSNFKQFVDMEDKLARQLTALARNMRLTHQSRWTEQKANTLHEKNTAAVSDLNGYRRAAG